MPVTVPATAKTEAQLNDLIATFPPNLHWFITSEFPVPKVWAANIAVRSMVTPKVWAQLGADSKSVRRRIINILDLDGGDRAVKVMFL